MYLPISLHHTKLEIESAFSGVFRMALRKARQNSSISTPRSFLAMRHSTVSFEKCNVQLEVYTQSIYAASIQCSANRVKLGRENKLN